MYAIDNPEEGAHKTLGTSERPLIQEAWGGCCSFGAPLPFLIWGPCQSVLPLPAGVSLTKLLSLDFSLLTFFPLALMSPYDFSESFRDFCLLDEVQYFTGIKGLCDVFPSSYYW